MNKKIKKWTLRITATVLFIGGLLLALILSPSLTYAHETAYHHFTIYHHSTLEYRFLIHLDEAETLVKESEIYDPELKLDICLNDGSVYPGILQTFLEPAFAWGFYDKVLLNGTLNCEKNFVELNGYRWNLTQLLAHEMIHCYQVEKFGFFHSKPFADIPNWKWEGYAEYVSRQSDDQKDLFTAIQKYLQSNKDVWEITYKDGTITSRQYYLYWIMVKYCLDVKLLSYNQLLNDHSTVESLLSEMLNWYQQQEEGQL